MKPSTINFIGTYTMFVLQLGVASGGIYCAVSEEVEKNDTK